MSRLYLFDTLFFIFRSFYAVSSRLHNSEGFPTNAVFGVLSTLQSIIRDCEIEHCVAVLESTKPLIRSQVDENYKANRPPVPEDLKVQIPVIIEMLTKLGMRTAYADGFEADDVLGTIAKRAGQAGWPVTIVSNDKDLAQVLANPGDINLLHTGLGIKNSQKYIYVEREQVAAQYGVPPELIADWLALMGDNSDNIVGLRGVGPKTAAKMLLKSGSLEELLANPQLGGKFASAIQENAARLRQNLQLSQINTGVELPWQEEKWEDYALKPLKEEDVPFFRHLNLGSFLQQYQTCLFPNPTLKDICS